MKIFRTFLILLAIIIFSGGCGGSSGSGLFEAGIDAMIDSMTLREKVGQ